MEDFYKFNAHEAYMSRALELARQGCGKVSPNPMVGCVLVRDGEIIGEGYHSEFGGPHAEVMAYKNAVKDPVDATVYITLEPCTFHGKTPACVQFLIENSVSEVYISMLDPNPKVNGMGVRLLENSGINVYTGILSEETKWLNRGYVKIMKHGIPWVIAKAAQSANGYLGIDSSTQTFITGNESKKHSHNLRAYSDSILVGRQTALIDDPQLNVREVPGVNPKRIILDTNRKLPLTLNVFRDNLANTIVLCSNARFERSRTSYCDYIPVDENEIGELDLSSILKTLAKEGINSVLVEGGAKLLKSFYTSDLIDEIYLYTSPNKLKEASLRNPIIISDEWDIIESNSLGEDSVLIAKRKVECLQE